jgi:hypothetical protein
MIGSPVKGVSGLNTDGIYGCHRGGAAVFVVSAVLFLLALLLDLLRKAAYAR